MSKPDSPAHWSAPRHRETLSLVLLSLFILVGMVVRLLLLQRPVQYDEAYTFLYFALRPIPALLADYSAPNNHVFHTLLVALSHRLLGPALWTLRLPAFLAGVLNIPAAFWMARRFGGPRQALAAAGLIALAPNLVDYSANGRGYTLIVLFSLLLAGLTADLLERPIRTGLVLWGILSALGMWTIPIFLFPASGITLWWIASLLTAPLPRAERLGRLKDVILVALLAALGTLLLYAPVILFGTGWHSLTGNDIVEPQTWPHFVANLRPRLSNTLFSWLMGLPPGVAVLFGIGLVASILFSRPLTGQRWPLPVFLVIGSIIVMLLQRVVPLARVWLFLYAFALIFAGVGLVGIVEAIVRRWFPPLPGRALVHALIGLGAIGLLVTSSLPARIRVAGRDFPEEQVAHYLVEHLRPEDVLVALPPTDVQTAFYLALRGLSPDVLYRPGDVRRGGRVLVLVRSNAHPVNTPQGVLARHDLLSQVVLKQGRQIYAYGALQVWAFPWRSASH